MSRHATYFGAKKVSYAGILPTVLRANRLLRGDTGAETTCRAIYQAIQDIVCQPGGRAFANLVVLGGRGTIGRQLIRHLSSHDATISIALPPIFVVDKSDGFSFNHPILLINCALPGAIEEHAASIPSHSVVLNEVYPAPNRQSIEFLTQRNIKVIHVAGVRGRAWPEFPDEYRGAIPCCAALADRELRVVVTALN